jgi:hypothetical protein
MGIAERNVTLEAIHGGIPGFDEVVPVPRRE